MAVLHLIATKKITLPTGLKKLLNTEEIYIPNKIYNMLEKKQNNKATIEVLKLIQNLKLSDDYVRDFVVINKIGARIITGLFLYNLSRSFNILPSLKTTN